MNRGMKLDPSRAFAWACLLAMLALTVVPLWVVVKTALTPSQDVFSQAAQLWPDTPTLRNFTRVLGLVSHEESLAMGGSGAEVHFLRAVGNSLLFTGIIVTLQVLTSSMAAYAFARLRFPGRELLFGLFVAQGRMVGAQAGVLADQIGQGAKGGVGCGGDHGAWRWAGPMHCVASRRRPAVTCAMPCAAR